MAARAALSRTTPPASRIGRTAGPANRPPSRPSRPAPPPPPLSKDALAGNVPLRTFGQLKQLWEARVEEPARFARRAGAAGSASDRNRQPANGSDQPHDQIRNRFRCPPPQLLKPEPGSTSNSF